MAGQLCDVKGCAHEATHVVEFEVGNYYFCCACLHGKKKAWKKLLSASCTRD